MIIERWTYKVKVGYRDEIIKVVKAAVEEAGLIPRVCSFEYGPIDVVIVDNEYESREAMDKNVAIRHDKGGPALAEWVKKRRELVISETLELLKVH
jgi:hypothetical protein